MVSLTLYANGGQCLGSNHMGVDDESAEAYHWHDLM